LFEDAGLEGIDQRIDKLRTRIKGLEDLKVSEDVFDRFTLLTLYELSNKGYFDVLHGSIKTGKESNVFLSIDRGGTPAAVKIHLMLAANFQAMLKYVEGDHRFKKIKKSRRNIILTWVEKEFRNLTAAYDSGVKVPRPIVSKKNVLIMEFIGEGNTAAPTLKEAGIKTSAMFRKVVSNTKKLFQAGLVHGDLSEYNILVHGGEPWLIDLSQSVPVEHPLAEELLIRDAKNMSRFFGKKFDKVYQRIIS